MDKEKNSIGTRLDSNFSLSLFPPGLPRELPDPSRWTRPEDPPFGQVALIGQAAEVVQARQIRQPVGGGLRK